MACKPVPYNSSERHVTRFAASTRTHASEHRLRATPNSSLQLPCVPALPPVDTQWAKTGDLPVRGLKALRRSGRLMVIWAINTLAAGGTRGERSAMEGQAVWDLLTAAVHAMEYAGVLKGLYAMAHQVYGAGRANRATRAPLEQQPCKCCRMTACHSSYVMAEYGRA